MSTLIAWSMRGALVMAVMAGAMACTSQEFTIEQPDGTVQTYRQVQLHPNLIVRPDQFEIRSAGATDEGFPVEVIIRRDGKGDTVYRVTPPLGDPVFFRQVAPGKPSTGTTPSRATDVPMTPVAERTSFDAYRVRVDLSLDAAELEGRRSDGAWTAVAHGGIASVARVAASRGLLPLEFDNEAGSWRLSVDRRFPLATLRRNGEIVQVRGLP